MFFKKKKRHLIFTWPLRLVPSSLRSAFTHLIATQNSFYINIIDFLQFPPRGTKSPPGQRSGAESVRRAGGVKIPVFISIPSTNSLPFIPSLPSLQFPPLRSGHFRSGPSVFFFSLILLRMFVSFSRQIPFRYAPWSFPRFLTHLLRATIFRTFLKSLLMKLVAQRIKI